MDKVVTVPAAAAAMGVSRIVLERAIKQKFLEVMTFFSGGKGGGFRLIPATSLQVWLEKREGYHEALKGGATKFHKWGAKINPKSIVCKALLITSTNKAA